MLADVDNVRAKKRPDDSTTGSDLVRSLLAMFKKLVRWVEFK